jgi:hypothetical protein
MRNELWKIGDKAIVNIPKENREWGYDPCPDGTVAEIVRFGEIYHGRVGNFGLKPGLYVNRSWINIRLPDGKKYFEWSGRLEPVDKEEAEVRLAEFQKQRADNPKNRQDSSEFLRDLPETLFWEGDVVLMDREGYDAPLLVVSIHYAMLGEMTLIGTKYPAYHISNNFHGGWETCANEDELSLIERGKVWKYLHHEPIEFANLKEEADLHNMLGLTDEVKNPTKDLYSWTLDEVLEAIKCGLVHGFVQSHMFGTPSIEALLFRDADLGKRVAKATLEGFCIES